MTKTVAIVQSNYIPWKGYFDLINQVDEFILFDDVQYTRRDWRNRNRIKTPRGPEWLTIPVDVKGKYLQAIKDTMVSDSEWAAKHWATIRHNYGRAPYFSQYASWLEDLYLGCRESALTDVNRRFLSGVCEVLGIGTRLTTSMDYYPLAEGRTEKLVGLCVAAGATHYVSGPAARVYLEESLFNAVGITVSYMDYSGYPPYRQLFGSFEHAVSIIDLLLNEGPNATRFMKSFGQHSSGEGVSAHVG